MAKLAIQVKRAAAAEVETQLLALPYFESTQGLTGVLAEVDSRMGGELGRILSRGDFRGKSDQALVVYSRPGELAAERVVLVGLGTRERFSLERLRRAVGTAVRQAERVGARTLAIPLDFGDASGDASGDANNDTSGDPVDHFATSRTMAEAATLAAWSFREFKTNDAEPQPELEELTLIAADEESVAEAERGAEHGRIVAEAENLARDLASRPGNVATPTHLAEIARGIAEEEGLELTVFDREAMREHGMHALLAVARGTEEEPRFIALEYRGEGAREGRKPLVLVGKGVTFDTGGISLKPSAGMEDMKYDMSGAAAVLGAIQAVARLKLPVHLVVLVPSTENMPSGRATRPGDVIGSLDGKTIEVVNTDAEGRLILVDALAYARRYEPEAIVNAATLTGACVIGLGHHAVGLMGNDDTLVDEIRAAGESTGERCWPLPLWDEYRKQLDSDIADLKNVGGRPAGTITAGWFLKEFVGTTPWAHLDIAGTAYRSEALPYLRKGATGIPTRLFVEWVRSRADA